MSAAPAQRKLASESERASKSIAKTGKAANGAKLSIGRMLGMSLLMSVAFRAFSAAINAIKDGFTNLAQYSVAQIVAFQCCGVALKRSRTA